MSKPSGPSSFEVSNIIHRGNDDHKPNVNVSEGFHSNEGGGELLDAKIGGEGIGKSLGEKISLGELGSMDNMTRIPATFNDNPLTKIFDGNLGFMTISTNKAGLDTYNLKTLGNVGLENTDIRKNLNAPESLPGFVSQSQGPRE